MRRTVFVAVAAFAVVASLAGCGKKAEQAQQASSSADSLLASNPTEQQSGNITPQTNYQQQSEPQAPPAAAPTKPATKPKPKPAQKPAAAAEAPSATLPTGTPFHVVIGTQITSETAQAGDAWSGTLKEAVPIGSLGVIPAGSLVHGVVEGAKPAEKGDRAMLVLRLTSVEVQGRSVEVSGKTDSLIAGSTRTRNVGAVAGSAAAGALIGRAIGGSGKGALIGGLIGGAAATGAVAKSKGFQVEVKEGVEMTFTLTRDSHLRL